MAWRCPLCERALHSETVHPGKSQVQHDAAWPVSRLAAQELLRCAEGFRLEACRLHQIRDRDAHSGVVIDDEHLDPAGVSGIPGISPAVSAVPTASVGSAK